ncbi:MAG TPA: hypothetical protein VM509_09485 [Planctomycetota bacterium]|nr:hypothetical protein [Planctomycetota bacterium]
MKSHYESDPLDDAGNEGEVQPKPVRPEPVRTPSGFDATLLMLMGAGCVCGGLLLSLGPRLSWKLSQIATGFKHLGVEGGVLVMGGLVLCGLGLLRRGQHAARVPTVEQAEDRALIEQLTKDSLRLAEELSRVESGLAHVEAELTSSRRTLEDQLSRGTQATQAVLAVVTAPREENTSEDAIFRLAASLDQVGMRIEQRLKTQYTALQDHLEDVGAAILSARNQVQGLQRTRDDHAAALREEVHAHVENALEETGIWSNPRKDGKLPSLGVLDSIDEHVEVELEQVDAALPLNPEEAREHGMTNDATIRIEEVDTKTRLVQLSTLLADPKLRQALEGIALAKRSEASF